MPLHWSPTQTIDSSPCCKTGPSSDPQMKMSVSAPAYTPKASLTWKLLVLLSELGGGNCPPRLRAWASRLNIKTLLYWFFMFLSCSPRVKNCKAFSLGLLHLIYRLRKLPTVAFIVCESASDLHELNQIAPRFMTQALNRNQCSHGRPQKYFQRRGSVEISLIPFRLLTMQRKWRFTKRFTLSTH